MTTGTWVIVELLGGVALLLWGIRMVRTGIMRAWGARLKRFIEDNLSNRLAAFVTGILATVFLQSGTATALVVTGLAASGLIYGATGLAVLLGADFGSSIITGVFAFGGPKITGLSPILTFAGFVLFSATSDFRPRNAGRIMMGLGFMLMALQLIVAAGDPIRDAPLFGQMLGYLGAEPFIALLVGAALTWLSYSTLAIMLLVTSFIAAGTIDLAAALPLILGINLGGGFPAVSSTMGQPAPARRLPMANLMCRAGFAVICIPLLGLAADWLKSISDDATLQAVVFHAGFNLGLALVALPLATAIMSGVERLLPDRADPGNPLAAPRFLDPLALETPGVALSNAQSETVRMTEHLDQMFVVASQAMQSGDLLSLKAIKQFDSQINGYHAAIHGYVAEITQADLQPEDNRRGLEILLYVSNLEHAGDIIHLNLTDRLKAKIREDIRFTDVQDEVLTELCAIVRESLRLAASVLTSRNTDGARRLIDQKHTFRARENELFQSHFGDSDAVDGRTLRASALFVDMVRDLHAINSHIASAAYPIVEEAGLLRDTRLRKVTKQR